MKATVPIICLVAAIGLAACIVLERQEALVLARGNNSLRQRLSQQGRVFEENKGLGRLLANEGDTASRRVRGDESSLPANDPVQELGRLRGELATLQQKSNQVENLRANTHELRRAIEAAVKTNRVVSTTANGSQFELVSADYGTDKTNLDVVAELRERMRGGSLKAIASNNLKGDPEFGQTKHLTVVYRIGGVTMTNQFREGAFVNLPATGDYYSVPDMTRGQSQ